MRTWLLGTFLPLTLLAQAQVIWSNPIEGTNPNTSNPYTAGQTVAANITVSGIGRGTANSGTNANNRYNANTWTSSAINTNAYFYFTITPNAGHKLNLSSFTYNGQASGTGPNSVAFRSSADNYAANVGSPGISSGTISLTGAAYQNLTGAITFRLYAWGASQTNGTFSVNDFSFSGSVVPLPSITASTTTLPAFSTMQGTPSDAQTFTVSAGGLSTPLTLTAPSGFELREAGVGSYANTVSFPAPTVTSRSIEVRLTGAASGNYAGNITCTSTDATTRNIAVTGEVTNVATVLTLSPATSTVSENAGTLELTVSIVNPSSTEATTALLVLTGDAARVGGFTDLPIEFPAGSSTPIVVPITITDNGHWDRGDEVLFTLENVTGGIQAIAANDASLITITEYLTYSLLINEVDYTMPDENAEFIELLNNGTSALDLHDFRVELVYDDNGAQIYEEFDLPHFVLAAGARYIICGSLTTVPSGHLVVSPAVDFIAGGLAAGIGLRNPDGALIDAMSYEGDVPGYGTGGGSALVDDPSMTGRSLARIPDGVDTNTASDWAFSCSTPATNNLTTGSACDDGDPNTVLDQVQSDCTCLGTAAPTEDCLGEANGPAMPGTACDDLDPETLNDTWTLECACIGTPVVRDCEGTIDGPAMPGTACNDDNAHTIDDTWTAACQCTGTLVPAAPQVTTAPATAIASLTATLHGQVIEVGSSAIVDQGFEWSTTSGFAPGTGTTVVSTDPSEGAFSAAVIGLEANTTYYYVAYAANNEGLTYGTQASFTTGQLSAPVATAGTGILATGFTANWEAVEGATGYRLDVSTSPTFGTTNYTTDLFLSEYVEGSSNNKYLEIYNGTGADVDLSDYKLALYSNGATEPNPSFNQEVTLSGVLPHGAVVVYKHGSATIYSGAATSFTNNGPLNYNGDDALSLFRISTGNFVDVFGSIGHDPGTAWTASGLSTVDRTLVRKNTVNGGVISNPVTGFPTLAAEWNGLPMDNVSGLGSHDHVSYVPDFLAGYQDLAVSGLSHEVTGLTSGVTYYYRVRAISANSTSPNSQVITVITGENDCLGEFNGPAVAGSPCDDGDLSTINDVFGADCICAGEPAPAEDCEGVANGPAMPGTTCDDGNVYTVDDTWTVECTCVGTFVPTLPTVTTAAASDVTATGGTLHGTITEDGSSSVSAYGFQWSTTAGTASASGTVISASELVDGGFNALLSGLAPGSSVYYVAFASNTEGTAYGSELELTTATLTAPVATAATDVDATSFTANWDAVAHATGYLLDVSTSPTFTGAVNATDLIISEYVEGSSSNKYLELFNGTGSDVDLTDYQLLLFANGAATPTNTVALTGTLASGAVVVYKNSSAAIYTGTAINSNATNFNGDDAVALRKVSTGSYVDIFGSIGFDPGTAWTAPGLSTLDRTLVRKSEVSAGLTENPANSFPTLGTEWTGHAMDDVSNLGQHTYAGEGPSFVSGYEALPVSGTAQVVSGLEPGTTYYYRVRAVIDLFTSEHSNVIDVTTGSAAGCTDPLAENHDGTATEDDGSCTYCPATVVHNTAIPTPIQIGTGLPADHAAVSTDCHPITIGLTAFERYVGALVPEGPVYRVAMGNSPTSGSDATPAVGLARWNYLLSVDLDTFDFTQVQVLLDVDFDPAVEPVWNTVDLSAQLAALGIADTSVFQAAENLGFDFWQVLFPGTSFDPQAVGTYSLRVRARSAASEVLLAELPITVEVFCPDTDGDGTSDCDDECPNDPNKVTAGACGCGVEDIATTWYADVDGDGFGDINAPLAGFTCIVPEGHVADSSDLCPEDAAKQEPGACGCGLEDIATTWYADVDGDGFGDINAPLAGFTCIVPEGHVADSSDLCPEDAAKQAPGACGCGLEDIATTWYADVDGDGLGDINAPLAGFTCIVPEGYVANSGDACVEVPGTIGSACDDGDPNTENDVLGEDCTCAGQPVPSCSGHEITVSVRTDGHGDQLSWTIVDEMNETVAAAGPFDGLNDQVVSTTVCLPNAFGNCYRLRLVDSFGDGITGGHWEVRDAQGAVVLRDVFASGASSPLSPAQISAYGTGHSFCLPLGPTMVSSTSCGVFTNIRQSKVFCEEVPGVSNYQFEFSDPDAGFLRRIAVPRNWVRFSEMVTSPLQAGVTYLTRVRVDQGLLGFSDDHFGAACELGMSGEANCTALIDNPGNNTHSCGAFRAFGGNNRIWAQPVTGATAYRFRFTHAASGYVRNVASANYVCVLNWSTAPLQNGLTYAVDVETLVNGTWSGYCGPVCSLTIGSPAVQRNLAQAMTIEGLELWPNPNSGDAVQVLSTGIDAEVATVEVLDLFGHVVIARQENVVDGTLRSRIDLAQGMASRVYIVRVIGNGQVTSGRLVVQR